MRSFLGANGIPVLQGVQVGSRLNPKVKTDGVEDMRLSVALEQFHVMGERLVVFIARFLLWRTTVLKRRGAPCLGVRSGGFAAHGTIRLPCSAFSPYVTETDGDILSKDNSYVSIYSHEQAMELLFEIRVHTSSLAVKPHF